MGYSRRGSFLTKLSSRSRRKETYCFDQDDVLAKQVRNLKVLVLDEADRMIEAGHFAEMDNILRLTVRQSKWGNRFGVYWRN